MSNGAWSDDLLSLDVQEEARQLDVLCQRVFPMFSVRYRYFPIKVNAA